MRDHGKGFWRFLIDLTDGGLDDLAETVFVGTFKRFNDADTRDGK
jgi:hypothetical protein